MAAATPPHARLLVAGELPALVFYRATYRLYPRTVIGYLVRPYTDVDGWVGAPDTWAAAVRYARRTRVQYVVLWQSSAVSPSAAIHFRRDGGILVEISR